MPVIDTIVIFSAADTKNKYHQIGLKYLKKANDGKCFIPSLALMEFDIVLQSRGFSYKERMEKHSLLLADFPKLEKNIIPIAPVVLYNIARLESKYELDYFDAGICAQSLQADGIIITPDRKISSIKEVSTFWE
ncbi:MAG: type II toxin-antitoxin system VapC family toxin [Candidatus Helarchaeota archaeon]